VVTDLGLGHGLLYKPRLEWLDPLAEWAELPAPRSRVLP
jgi:hypothetical protein